MHFAVPAERPAPLSRSERADFMASTRVEPVAAVAGSGRQISRPPIASPPLPHDISASRQAMSASGLLPPKLCRRRAAKPMASICQRPARSPRGYDFARQQGDASPPRDGAGTLRGPSPLGCDIAAGNQSREPAATSARCRAASPQPLDVDMIAATSNGSQAASDRAGSHSWPQDDRARGLASSLA